MVFSNFFAETINYFIMVHTPRTEICWQADISRIILVHKLQMLDLGLGLGLKIKIGLQAQVLSLAARGLGFAGPGFGLDPGTAAVSCRR